MLNAPITAHEPVITPSSLMLVGKLVQNGASSNKVIVPSSELRDIEARYDVSRSALDRHIKRHVTAALRKLTAADRPIAQAAEIGEPVLVEARRPGAPASATAALQEANVCPR